MAEHWSIKATKQTPAINFDFENHILEIVGESYPENITAFSVPLFSQLEQYLAKLQAQTFTVNIELIYFNSSSSKMLLDFFDLLETEAAERNGKIIVNWIYDVDNDSVKEYGEEFQEDLRAIVFNVVEKIHS